MRKKYFLISSLLIATLTLPLMSSADDGNAAIGLGGIEFKKTDAVSMESEELFLSPSKVKVRFNFKNLTTKDHQTIVAFPVPEYSADLAGCEIGMNTPCDDPMSNDAMRVRSSLKTFSVLVNGKKISPQTELKAFVDGREITSILQKKKIPIDDPEQAVKSFQSFSPAEKKEWIDQKIVTLSEGHGESLSPHWKVKRNYYWDQLFPAGKNIQIEHEYSPVLGIAQGLSDREHALYCVDDAFKKTMDKTCKLNLKKNPDAACQVFRTLDYILTSANSWSGPIRDFTLTIEKSSPDQIVSLCFDQLKKTGPKTFQSKLKNFKPSQEIHVVFMSGER